MILFNSLFCFFKFRAYDKSTSDHQCLFSTSWSLYAGYNLLYRLFLHSFTNHKSYFSLSTLRLTWDFLSILGFDRWHFCLHLYYNSFEMPVAFHFEDQIRFIDHFIGLLLCHSSGFNHMDHQSSEEMDTPVHFCVSEKIQEHSSEHRHTTPWTLQWAVVWQVTLCMVVGWATIQRFFTRNLWQKLFQTDRLAKNMTSVWLTFYAQKEILTMKLSYNFPFLCRDFCGFITTTRSWCSFIVGASLTYFLLETGWFYKILRRIHIPFVVLKPSIQEHTYTLCVFLTDQICRNC